MIHLSLESLMSDLTRRHIEEVCAEVRQMLFEKNRRYGDSAINPVRLFSRADPVEQIKVRIDDKLSRLHSGQSDEDEDIEMDLIGYLILLRVARRTAKAAEAMDGGL